MSTELSILLHNQLGEPLTHFLNTQGENLPASKRATAVVLPTIILGLLNYVNGNRDQAIALYNQIMGSQPQPYHHLVAQLPSMQLNEINQITEIGKSLVSQIFGSHAQPIAAQIAQFSGVSNGGAYQLLNTALPLVLSVFRVRGWDAQGFYRLLGAQNFWLAQVLPETILSLLGIGSASGLSASVMGMSSTLAGIAGVPAAVMSDTRWHKILIFLLLGGLSVWGLRACMQPEMTATVPPHHTETATTAVATPPALMVSEPAMLEQAASVPTTTTDLSEAAHTAIALNNSLVVASAPAAVSEPVASISVPLANESRVMVESGMVKFYFATGMSRIPKDTDKVAKEAIVAGKAGKKLTISGYTDSTGNAKLNAELSKKRAETVRDFFISHGVPAKRIVLRKPENSVGAQGKNQEGRRVDVAISD